MSDRWADEHFDFEDALNAEIWRVSPSRGAELAAANAHSPAGGWQDRWATPQLPWVPDLVGRRWRSAGGVVVIGSAYAPFVVGSASRSAAMPRKSYSESANAGEFGRHFLTFVVRPDGSYYRGIHQLLDQIVDSDRVVVTDFCRASFVVRRPDGSFASGDDAVGDHLAQYEQWVDAGADWTLERLRESGSRVFVVLGGLAWRTLDRVARGGGAVFRTRNRDFGLAPGIQAGEIVLGGIARTVLRITHPARRNQRDPYYANARRALATVLGVDAATAPGGPGGLISTDEREQSATPSPDRPARSGVRRVESMDSNAGEVLHLEETAAGRIHLQNFGARYGGQYGKHAFAVVVSLQSGVQLGPVHGVTVSDLFARMDCHGKHYQASTYHKTDLFFVEGGRLRGGTAVTQELARRLNHAD